MSQAQDHPPARRKQDSGGVSEGIWPLAPSYEPLSMNPLPLPSPRKRHGGGGIVARPLAYRSLARFMPLCSYLCDSSAFTRQGRGEISPKPKFALCAQLV